MRKFCKGLALVTAMGTYTCVLSAIWLVETKAMADKLLATALLLAVTALISSIVSLDVV